MDKCRFCLKNSKNVKYIFDTANDQGITYAEMINSITKNVKVNSENVYFKSFASLL